MSTNTAKDGSVTDIPANEKGNKTPSKSKKTISKTKKPTDKSNPKNAGATPGVSKTLSHEPISDRGKQNPPPTKEKPPRRTEVTTRKSNPKNAGATPGVSKITSHEPISDRGKPNNPPTKEKSPQIPSGLPRGTEAMKRKSNPKNTGATPGSISKQNQGSESRVENVTTPTEENEMSSGLPLGTEVMSPSGDEVVTPIQSNFFPVNVITEGELHEQSVDISERNTQTGLPKQPTMSMDPSAAANCFFQTLQAAFQSGNQPIVGNFSVPKSGPTALATATQPDGPGDSSHDDPPVSAGDSAGRSRPRQREGSSRRSREASPTLPRSFRPGLARYAASIQLDDESNSELSYHRPMAGSRKRKWTDSASSSTLSDMDYTGISRKRTTFSVPDNDIASDSASLLGESVHEFPPKDADDVNIKPLQPAEIITKYCPQLKAEQAEQQQNVPKPIFCLDSHLSGDKQASSCAIKLDAPFISCMNSLSDRGTRLKPLRKEVSRKFPSGKLNIRPFSRPRPYQTLLPEWGTPGQKDQRRGVTPSAPPNLT